MSERERKILQAIGECDRYIAKEQPRRADTRPADVAKRLEFYKTHRAKLIAMQDGWYEVTGAECTDIWDALQRAGILFNGCTRAELDARYGPERIKHVAGIGWFKRSAHWEHKGECRLAAKGGALSVNS